MLRDDRKESHVLSQEGAETVEEYENRLGSIGVRDDGCVVDALNEWIVDPGVLLSVLDAELDVLTRQRLTVVP